MSVINVYAPTESGIDEEKEKFDDNLEAEIEIDSKKNIGQVARKHTIHEKTNTNGQKLCYLAANKNFRINSNKYEHQKFQKIKWVSQNGTVANIVHQTRYRERIKQGRLGFTQIFFPIQNAKNGPPR